MTERDEAVEIIVCALHRHAAHADVFALVLATSPRNRLRHAAVAVAPPPSRAFIALAAIV